MKEIMHYLIGPLFLAFLVHTQSMQSASTGSLSVQTQQSNLKAEQPTKDQSSPNISPREVQIIIILLSILLTIALVGIITHFVCKKKRVARCTKKMCRKNKMIPTLRQKYDIVGQNTITELQFQNQCKKIVKMFEKSLQNQVFKYKLENQQQNHFCKIAIKETKAGNYHYIIELEGEDKFGEWDGEGSIVCHKNQFFVWFTQQYYDISKIWNKQMRLFASTSITSQIVTGTWEIQKQVQNQNCIGVWVLQLLSNHTGVSIERIDSISERQ